MDDIDCPTKLEMRKGTENFISTTSITYFSNNSPLTILSSTIHSAMFLPSNLLKNKME